MKKKLLALVALLSFYQAFLKPALAQQVQEQPTTATEISGKAEGHQPVVRVEIHPQIETTRPAEKYIMIPSKDREYYRLLAAKSNTSRNEPRGSWRGAQWGLFLLGIISTFILTLIAPRATKQATDTAVFEPGRSLIVGLIAGLGAIVVLLANAALVNSPFGLLYAPFGAVIALVPMAVVVAGWICGMRLIGDWAAQKAGKPQEGSLFARITLGLFLFLIIKVAVGGSMLGSATLFFEGVVALLGTGALLITGFGSRPDWLGARLRGETRWFGKKQF